MATTTEAPRGMIVTLGGGGFSMSEDGTSLIDDHLLELTGKANPKVCFIGTASGDSVEYRQRFTDAFGREALHEWVASGELPDTWAADDNVAIVWKGGEIVDVVCEVPGKYAAHVRRVDGQAVEERLDARYLG